MMDSSTIQPPSALIDENVPEDSLPDSVVSKTSKYPFYSKLDNTLFYQGVLTSARGHQFVERHERQDRRAGTLLYSAKFRSGGLPWQLHNEGGLLHSTNNFIAQVWMDKSQEVDSATTFHEAIQALEKCLKIQKVYHDQLLQDTREAEKEFEDRLRVVCFGSTDDREATEDLSQLCKLLKTGLRSETELAMAIVGNAKISSVTKEALEKYVGKRAQMFDRESAPFLKDGWTSTAKSLLEIMTSAIQEGTQLHRVKLMDLYSGSVRNKVAISSDEGMLEMMKGRLDEIDAAYENELLTDTFQARVFPLLSNTYMKLLDKVNTRDPEQPSKIDAFMKNQLDLYVQILNYYSKQRDSNFHKFVYSFMDNHQSKAKDFPAELHVWMCLLDNAIAHMFPHEFLRKALWPPLERFFHRMALYGDLDDEKTLKTVESIFSSLMWFVIQAGRKIQEKSTLDVSIMMNQITIIEKEISTRENFRKLVDQFTNYWIQLSEAIKLIPALFPLRYLANAHAIEERLRRCMSAVLERKLGCAKHIEFCELFNQFVADLRELKWFVRLPSSVEASSKLILINNKWNNTDTKCFLVKDREFLVNLLVELNIGTPEHIGLEIVEQWVMCLESMSMKDKWVNGQEMAQGAGQQALISLIQLMRDLLRLREQPKHECWTDFKDWLTIPLIKISNGSYNEVDFKRRIYAIRKEHGFRCEIEKKQTEANSKRNISKLIARFGLRSNKSYMY